MQEYDWVALNVENEYYAEKGLHKGAKGCIMDPRKIDGCWLVIFDGKLYQDEDGEWTCDDVELVVKEEDLILLEASNADLSSEYLCFTHNPQIIDNVPDDLYEVLERRGELDKCFCPIPNPKDKKTEE